MGKQELIEKWENKTSAPSCKISASSIRPSEYEMYNVGYGVARVEIIEDLKRLDEPQKVKVPAFVADWFEENKHNLSNSLWEFTAELNEKTLVTGAIYTEFESWFIAQPRAYEFITSMGKGYEVEQPKRYMVRLNNGEGYIFDITRSWTYKKLFETKNEADARAELHDGTVEEVPNEL